MGGVIHIGFGVMLLLTVIVIVIIGLVNPPLFEEIIRLLREIARAIFPSAVLEAL